MVAGGKKRWPSLLFTTLTLVEFKNGNDGICCIKSMGLTIGFRVYSLGKIENSIGLLADISSIWVLEYYKITSLLTKICYYSNTL